MRDLKMIAENAPYYLATSIEQTPYDRFWVVLLEGSVEVYQSAEDPTLDEPNSWMRLKLFCEQQDVKIVNMAKANKSLDPNMQINLDPAADGYYYSRRMRKMMSANPAFCGYEDISQGIGELHGDDLRIIWELEDGRAHVELRKLSDYPKSSHVSLIRK